MARQYIITVDYENNAEQWWMAKLVLSTGKLDFARWCA